MSKVCLTAAITTDPAELDPAIAATETMSAAAQREPGTEVHLFGVDRENSTLWFFEVYSDDAAFDAHCTTSAMAAYAAFLGGLTGSTINTHRLEPLGTAASG